MRRLLRSVGQRQRRRSICTFPTTWARRRLGCGSQKPRRFRMADGWLQSPGMLLVAGSSDWKVAKTRREGVKVFSVSFAPAEEVAHSRCAALRSIGPASREVVLQPLYSGLPWLLLTLRRIPP